MFRIGPRKIISLMKLQYRASYQHMHLHFSRHAHLFFNKAVVHYMDQFCILLYYKCYGLRNF